MRRTTVILMLCVKTLMVPTLAAVRRVTLETAEIAQVTQVENPNRDFLVFFSLMVMEDASGLFLLFCNPAIPTLLSFCCFPQFTWSCILSVLACLLCFVLLSFSSQV